MSSTIAAAALGALTIGTGQPAPAQAAIPPETPLSLSRLYSIPAGSLGSALNSFADKSGLHILYDAHVTRRMTSLGLEGSFSVRQGLDRLLSGTGLAYRFADDGESVSILLAQNDRVRSDASGAETLPPIDIGSERRRSASGSGGAPGFDAARAREPIYRDPPGQSTTTIDHRFLDRTPLFTVQEMLQYSPGVSVQQGLSTRDQVVSIRGSANRLIAGVRNIMMYEDGFPIVTSDGSGRTDLLDPHAFSAIDVYRGPSSAMFGNYAYGGAINFRSYSGAEIDGVHAGSEFGSFGHINSFIRAGRKFTDPSLGDFDVSMFASYSRGDHYIEHMGYDLGAAKLLVKWSPSASDRFVLKGLYSDNFSDMQLRISQSQFYSNPFQSGCRVAGTPNCASTNQPTNGVFGPPISAQSTSQLGQHSHRIRLIGGARWEHDFDAATTWRTQITYDYLEIASGTNPPPSYTPPPFRVIAGPVSLKGPSYGVSVATDITRRDVLLGLPATHFLGFFYDNVKSVNPTTLWLPNVWNYGASGAPINYIDSFHSNVGLKAREEIALTDELTAAVGFSSNWNKVSGTNTIYNYTNAGLPTAPTLLSAETAYWNTAPEASLTYRYSPEWQLRARYAVGYGTPNFTWLTTTANGSGNNTALKPQTNMGVDLGVDWTPSTNLTFGLTGFYEWFRNEILGQVSPLGFSYYNNVPAAIHRGIEANVDWRPFDGWRFIGSYTYNDQFFTRFDDALSATVVYDRSGNKIPNVPPHNLTARIGYDQPLGDLKGLGGYVEYSYRSDYTIDNANLTSIPSYGLVNVNLHYSRDFADAYFKNIELYFDVRNIFDRTYVAGAGVMTNTLIAGTTTQTPAAQLANSTTASIIAGAPRSFIGGVKFKF
ncbi:TonB-dependent receptor [Methylosinus sp. Sm6]|uniref:TonB-dependent receptor domain-containing protein n=1 Tax=Methylosinus sp. Sm6 TaxID=2866948 RepID=UPI0021031C68|nr:TonB-dependent receptor [Methylosinus sp. Sm6]